MKKFFLRTLYIVPLSLILSFIMASCDGNDPNPQSQIPAGAIKGIFTVDKDGRQVRFSQGNLQYFQGVNGNGDWWQFATKQWEYFGKNQSDDHRDLFGWGTGNKPNELSLDDTDYADFVDWGKVNAIINGGNKAGLWRTLREEEWTYLLGRRPDATKLVGMGSVNDINGLILLPDDWKGEMFDDSENGLELYSTSSYAYYRNKNKTNYQFHTYTKEQWAVLEADGAVFLPAAGSREELVYGGNAYGNYWTPTLSTTQNRMYRLNFSEEIINPQQDSQPHYAYAVRLVSDVK